MSHPIFGGIAQRGGENITCILRFPRGLLQFRYRYQLGYSGVQLVLCFCFVFLRLVCPMLPVSLGCPPLIAPSVLSNVYLSNCCAGRNNQLFDINIRMRI